MDELELLKQDWKKKENSFEKLMEKDIVNMLHKKSSSLVKRIFIISILEFIFWVVLAIFLKQYDYVYTNETIKKFYIMEISEFISYGILLYFIYIFYRNYKRISVFQPVKELIKNILSTRKAVQTYVKITIGYIILFSLILFFVEFNFDPKYIDLYNQVEEKGKGTLFILIAFFTYVIFIGIYVLLVWLFYKLIYGILLKRLYKNYEELKKIEM